MFSFKGNKRSPEQQRVEEFEAITDHALRVARKYATLRMTEYFAGVSYETADFVVSDGREVSVSRPLSRAVNQGRAYASVATPNIPQPGTLEYYDYKWAAERNAANTHDYTEGFSIRDYANGIPVVERMVIMPLRNSFSRNDTSVVLTPVPATATELATLDGLIRGAEPVQMLPTQQAVEAARR